MKKKSSIGEILLYLFAFVILGLFLYGTVQGANSVSRVIKAGNSAVTLKATLSGYDERTEIDEGFESTYYDTYVSYDYEGNHYDRVHYGSSQKEPKLGKTVTVKIDPDNPDELLASTGEMGIAAVVSCLFLSGIAMIAYCALRDWLITFTEENAKIYAYLLVTALLAAAGGLYYHTVGTWVYMIYGGVALLLMLLLLYLMARKKAAA